MRQLHSHLKKGEITVQAENKDDLWCLSMVIEPGDTVNGKTLRKVSAGDKEQRAKSVTRKPVFLAIQVEKVDFNPSSALRISGTVRQGPEDVPLGSYHTFNVDEDTPITIIKERWLDYQLGKLKEFMEPRAGSILICVLDREEAYFALMKKYGYELLSTLKGNVQKKGDDSPQKGDFYPLIVKQLQEYNRRHTLATIIIASPAFWKDDLVDLMADEALKGKIVKATCSSVGENGIGEVLKRPEVKEALKQERVAREMQEVEELFTEIARGGAAAYGMAKVKQAALAGAIRTLLITDAAIQGSREQGTYREVEGVMRTVDKAKGTILIVSSEHEGGQKLNGLGGIGAVLRYKAY